MKKSILLFTAIILMTTTAIGANFAEKNLDQLCDVNQLYDELNLESKVSFQAFQQAVEGYKKIDVKKSVLTLIDFSKASTEERLYVIDMEKRIVLYESHVAHGQNSGSNYTTSFSNEMGSHQSSLGFFLTENMYQGYNGLSLVLNGLERGINDKAKPRAIVIHGADYADPKLAKTMGRLGRSYGCPALPRELTRPIIDIIKDGSLVYAYSEKFNDTYLENSSVL